MSSTYVLAERSVCSSGVVLRLILRSKHYEELLYYFV